MERSKIYIGILISILGIAQFIQMFIGANVLYSWSRPQAAPYFQILKSRTEVLKDLESYQSISNTEQDTFFTLKRDLYLLTNEAAGQITWLEVETDSPKTIDSIQFYEYTLPLEEYAKLSLMNFQLVNWIRDTLVGENGSTILISKEELYDSILEADNVQALVSHKSEDEPMSCDSKLFFSPLFGPLFLITIVLFI